MKRKIRNIGLIFFALLFVFAASGCSEKEEGAKNQKETVAAEKKSNDPKKQEKELQDFILKNTKVVQIFNISKRVNPQSPDLGPFDVVRGIDERGQKTEIWIRENKIYEMTTSGSNNPTAPTTNPETTTPQ